MTPTELEQELLERSLHKCADKLDRLTNVNADLLSALEALLSVCDEELDPKRTPEMRIARRAINLAKGQTP